MTSPLIQTLPALFMVDKAGISSAILAVALVGLAFVVVDLIRVVDEHNVGTTSKRAKRLTSCRDRIVDAVPLTSIKVVLVAWQIVTQVGKDVVLCHNVVQPP